MSGQATMQLGTTYCVSISVRGALKNFTRRELGNLFVRSDGTSVGADEAKDVLLERLSKGHECLPMGDCANFDPLYGCLGHQVER